VCKYTYIWIYMYINMYGFMFIDIYQCVCPLKTHLLKKLKYWVYHVVSALFLCKFAYIFRCINSYVHMDIYVCVYMYIDRCALIYICENWFIYIYIYVYRWSSYGRYNLSYTPKSERISPTETLFCNLR
jgi:hypothetical protein